MRLPTSVLKGFALIAILLFKLWDAFITFATVGKYVPPSLKKISNAKIKKIELDELRRNYIKKRFTVIEM